MKRKIAIFCGITAVVTIIILLSIIVGKYKQVFEMEKNVVIGSVDNLSKEELIEKMDKQIEDSMITISINATPVMSLSKVDEGVNWFIENPEDQEKLISVKISLDENGQSIYETGIIEPGMYITGTKLDTMLKIGTYPCTAMFFAYDMDNQKFLGKAGAKITLTVQK